MAEAKALFKRHFTNFLETGDWIQHMKDPTVAKQIASASSRIYAACILAEAVSNEPDAETRVCPRCSGGK